MTRLARSARATAGPLVAHVRALLTPHPMREMRVKGQFMHHKEIRGAQGVKIVAHVRRRCRRRGS